MTNTNTKTNTNTATATVTAKPFQVGDEVVFVGTVIYCGFEMHREIMFPNEDLVVGKILEIDTVGNHSGLTHFCAFNSQLPYWVPACDIRLKDDYREHIRNILHLLDS